MNPGITRWKDGRFEAKRLATDGSFALFARTQTTKVFRRFGNDGCEEFHGDASSCFTTNLNIKEHTRIGRLIGSFRKRNFLVFASFATIEAQESSHHEKRDNGKGDLFNGGPRVPKCHKTSHDSSGTRNHSVDDATNDWNLNSRNNMEHRRQDQERQNQSCQWYHGNGSAQHRGLLHNCAIVSVAALRLVNWMFVEKRVASLEGGDEE
mmetsp:Transcript_10060/g.18268  ORF Transcript_10060/g.18268 Transcript_10060/m.18268 type:complete len:208 (-) Transcript_10060:492-1115(-)